MLTLAATRTTILAFAATLAPTPHPNPSSPQLLLAVASWAWAMEATFVVALALGQRLRLLTLRGAAAAVTRGREARRALPAAQQQVGGWIGSLPRSTEDFSQAVSRK